MYVYKARPVGDYAWRRSRVARFLVGVDVPDDVVRKTVHAIAGTLCHFRKAFCLGLVLEGVAGEVYACGCTRQTRIS